MSVTTALFLFAHQDDECGVFQSICSELTLCVPVHCCYFTSGTQTGLNSDIRNLESQKVLLSLGVEISNIHFVGSDFSIPDGNLIEHMHFIYQWISLFLEKSGDSVNIYLPAWEGGHPDHDVLHAAGTIAAHHAGLITNTLQFPLYNGYRCFGPFFRTLLPLPENGDVELSRISVLNRFKFLALCLKYPSQLKTWIGLFPFFLMHYIFWGSHSLQNVSLERLNHRPHSGSLYYERRKFSNWKTVSRKLNLFKQLIDTNH